MNHLSSEIHFPTKFSEVDSMRVVWHGHYIRYFEDGREAFGREYQLTYMDFFKVGLMVPLVKINCEYKRSLTYGEQVRCVTQLMPYGGAKLKFEYRLFKEDGRLAAKGSSEQVFLSSAGDLNLTIPDIMVQFYRRHNIPFEKFL